jgi:dolichyl-phosphate beta-glucosyltransferase
MRNSKIQYSIIVPAYKEEKFIEGTLKYLYEYLVDNKILNASEVIVVTADTPDKTIDIVSEKINMFPNHQHIKPGVRVGKGRDVKAGLSAAHGDYILFMDADLATPLKYIAIFFDMMKKEGGMVIGAREINTMHDDLVRKVSSYFANLIIKILIGWGIKDSQCGFKAFDRKSVDIILNRSKINGWGFDFEFIKIAKIQKIKITTIDIPDWSDPKPEGMGLSGDSQFKAMQNTFSELLKVKTNQLKGLYR